MVKKTAAVFLAFFLMLASSGSEAGGLFPSASEMFGISMPSVALALGRPADETEESEEGQTQTFLNFGADEYTAFGRYLAGIEATVRGYEIRETDIDVHIAVRGSEMLLNYNWEAQKGTAFYPAGTRPEPEKARTEGENSLLPPVGGILPSPEFAVGRAPDEVKNEAGVTVLSWLSFPDDDYAAFDLYLGQSGAILQKSEIESGTLNAVIRMNGAAFTFVYDWNGQTARCLYPEGTQPESCGWIMNKTANGILPSVKTIGQELPGLYNAIEREPGTVRALRDGSILEVYNDFYDADYDAFSRYLKGKSCIVEDFRTERDSVLIIQLSNGSGKMTFTYDALSHEGRVLYPAGTRMEISWPVTVPDLAVGSIVLFGHYEQDNDLSNGPEPIEWIVIARDGDNVLLLSKYGLDAVSYNQTRGNIMWEQCTLRSWLNSDFLRASFSEEEQALILTTEVINGKDQGYDKWPVRHERNTGDQLFLLSYKEVFEDYLTDDQFRTCKPTAYAVAQNVSVTSRNGNCPWWLRSPGIISSNAARVNDVGSCYSCSADYESGALRPALWVNLDSVEPVGSVGAPG